jgi:hypothetical protein
MSGSYLAIGIAAGHQRRLPRSGRSRQMLKAIHASEDVASGSREGFAGDREAVGVAFCISETSTKWSTTCANRSVQIECLLREIRRRTRMVSAFPDGQSALNLTSARLRHIAGTASSSKRYLNVELLKDQQTRTAIRLEPERGVASPNPKCERFLTRPIART